MNRSIVKRLVVPMLLVCLAGVAAGQDLKRAADTLERYKQVLSRLTNDGKLPGEQLDERLVIVDPEVADAITPLLEVDDKSPWLVAWTDIPGDGVSGSFRYEVLNEAKQPVRVVEAELKKLSDLEFYHAMRFLAALHHVAQKIDTVPGPIHRGLIHLLVHAETYPTPLIWSSQEIDEAALVYLLEATNGRPLDINFLQTGDQRGLRGDVESGLRALYPSLPADRLQALVSYVFEGPGEPSQDQIIPGVEAEPKAKPVFRLAHVLSGGQADFLHRHEPMPSDWQAAIRSRVIERLTEAGAADGFRYLPARFRLLRTARALANGRDAVVVARTQAGLKTNDSLNSATVEQIDAFRLAERKRFDDEIALRLRGLDISTPAKETAVPAIVTRGETLFDPRAMAEMAALLINDSVPFAAHVRIPFAESGGTMTKEAVKAGVDRALRDLGQKDHDQLLDQFFQRYGRPLSDVRDAPGNEAGKVLVLKWIFSSSIGKKEPVGSVEVHMADAASRGGSGLPIEPAILLTQPVMSASGIPFTEQKQRPLADAVVGDFVQALLPFQPGKNEPGTSLRWYQLRGTTPIATDLCIRITANDRRFAGTPSQRLFARRSASANWDWVPLEELRKGDAVWLIGGGSKAITGIEHLRGGRQFAQLSVAGADHVNADGFLARTREVKLPAESLHGIVPTATTVAKPFGKSGELTSRSLADLKSEVDWKERRFVEVKAVHAKTAEPVVTDDLLTNLQQNSTPVVYWISYLVDGSFERIGTGPSHGFLVKTEKDPAAIVAAHDIQEGDLLYRVGADQELGFATVVSVAIQADGDRQIIHPRLLENEWMPVNDGGIILHTDTEAFEPGLLRSTKIQLVDISIGVVGLEGAETYLVGKTVPINEISVFTPLDAKDGQGRLLRDASGHNLLAAHPGAPPSESWVMSRTASRLESTIVGGVYRIITADGRALFCSAGTALWQETGDPESKEKIRPIATVKAHLLKPGTRILVLADGNRFPQPDFQRVESVTWISAANHTTNGVFEVFRVDLTTSAVGFIQHHQSNYENLFANGVLVNLGRPVRLKDRFAGSSGAGASGRTGEAGSGVSHGPVNDPVKLSENDFTRQMISLPAPPQPEQRLELDPDDRKILEESLERLDREMDRFRLHPIRLPTAGSAEEAQLSQFLRTCIDDSKSVEDVCTSDNLFYAYGLYVDLRWDLIKRGQPNSLSALTHQGLRIAYPLHACGGPGKQLLDDLLTIHMRLALKKGGQALWTDDALWTRRLLQFAYEFDVLTRQSNNEPTERGLSAFREVGLDAADWIDLVQNRTEVDINPDVITLTTDGNQMVRPYRLMLQLDEATTRADRVPEGLIFPGLDTESRDLFRALSRHLEIKRDSAP